MTNVMRDVQKQKIAFRKSPNVRHIFKETYFNKNKIRIFRFFNFRKLKNNQIIGNGRTGTTTTNGRVQT